MGLRGECFTRDPRCEQPELHEALHTIAVVRLPQGICHRLDEPKAASDLGGISGAEAIDEDGELETAEHRDAEGAAEAMAPLLQAAQDESVGPERKSGAPQAGHATPPRTAGLPAARGRGTRRTGDDAAPASSV